MKEAKEQAPAVLKIDATAEMANAKKPAPVGATRIHTDLDYVGNVVNTQSTLVLRRMPGIDDITAIAILMNEGGREIFPNLFGGDKRFEAKLLEFDNGDPAVTKDSSKLCLGFGGGKFDYRAAGVQNESSATLVAKAVGLIGGKVNCPWWISSVVEARDSIKKPTAKGSMHQVVRKLYALLSDKPDSHGDVIEFGVVGVCARADYLRKKWSDFCSIYRKEKSRWEAWYTLLGEMGELTPEKAIFYLRETGAPANQVKWFSTMAQAAKNYEETLEERVPAEIDAAKFHPLMFNGRMYFIVTSYTDNHMVAKALFGRAARGRVLACVTENGQGHKGILLNSALRLTIGNRLYQQIQNREKTGATWYIPREGNFMLCGSDRHPDAILSQQNLVEITTYLQRWFDDEAHEPRISVSRKEAFALLDREK